MSLSNSSDQKFVIEVSAGSSADTLLEIGGSLELDSEYAQKNRRDNKLGVLRSIQDEGWFPAGRKFSREEMEAFSDDVLAAYLGILHFCQANKISKEEAAKLLGDVRVIFWESEDVDATIDDLALREAAIEEAVTTPEAAESAADAAKKSFKEAEKRILDLENENGALRQELEAEKHRVSPVSLSSSPVVPVKRRRSPSWRQIAFVAVLVVVSIGAITMYLTEKGPFTKKVPSDQVSSNEEGSGKKEESDKKDKLDMQVRDIKNMANSTSTK